MLNPQNIIVTMPLSPKLLVLAISLHLLSEMTPKEEQSLS